MKKWYFLVFLLLLNTEVLAQKAVCIVPVADLLGQSITHFKLANSVEQAYKDISVAWGVTKTECEVCPRVHQLIFNEVVDIVEDHGEEVVVDISNVFYGYPESRDQKFSRYWTLKKNLMTFDELNQKKIPIAMIPEPISYQKNTIVQANKGVVTLAFPLHLHPADIIYSVGTRFVIAKEGVYENLVYAINPHAHTLTTLRIPKNMCVHVAYDASESEKQKVYVQLLHQWVCRPCGLVPYIWGGCSLQTWCTADQFVVKKRRSLSGQQVSYWAWPVCERRVLSGFDCSTLVVRSAQAASIPFYYKNTATMESFLKELGNDQIVDGDLLWFHGHVIIASDIAHNKVIESRGYGSGHGRLHEVPLAHMFKDINTYDQLVDAYRAKKPIGFLNARGQVQMMLNDFKILRFASCWQSS